MTDGRLTVFRSCLVSLQRGWLGEFRARTTEAICQSAAACTASPEQWQVDMPLTVVAVPIRNNDGIVAQNSIPIQNLPATMHARPHDPTPCPSACDCCVSLLLDLQIFHAICERHCTRCCIVRLRYHLLGPPKGGGPLKLLCTLPRPRLCGGRLLQGA